MAGRRLCRHALICVSACLLTCIAILCLWIQESGKDLCLAIGGVFRPPAVMVPAEVLTFESFYWLTGWGAAPETDWTITLLDL
ncbi:hypothetical protein NPIL_423571 [Nephila pilipes]|uniref:Uncharacterized protein n=1 Tax=Nephila pilipes TaxID=299642 RepID=A0A8X6IR73_NEPPI|nr:hypothetical protein NPIL_423571 [Nephila pilipes]